MQNSVFSSRTARFVIFPQCALLFSHFQQSALPCTKQKLSAQGQHVNSFSHYATYFLAIFSKVHEFLQNSVFSRRSARFVNSALGASLYSDYQQSARVCTKQSFKPDFGTFSHCRTGHTTFERFSAKCTGLAQISTFYHFSTGHTTF